MKTMYRMNVEMAYSAPVAIHNIPGSGIEYEELPAETEDEEKIPINNLYNTILLRIEKDKLYLSPTFSLQDLSENMNTDLSTIQSCSNSITLSLCFHHLMQTHIMHTV